MSKDYSEILTHLGEIRENYFNSISPPVIQSSNFQFDSIQQFREFILHESKEHVYTRGNNPTVDILRKKLAALENTEDALVTSSGAAAISCTLSAFLSQGDHVVCVEKPYSWTYKLLTELLSRFGVTYTFVDGTDNQQIEAAIQPNTKLLYLESPNSLTFECQDLTFCAKLSKKYKLISIIDNSHASPVFQNPAEYGIDIVIHSGTKYINGHSDVVVGVICGSKDHIQRIFQGPFMTFGTNISPHDAWLVLRGLRTLPLRIQQSDATAHKIVEYLIDHPKVKKVLFPLHPSFPQYNLAKKQMTGCGGLFTVELKAETKEQVYNFVNGLEKFLLAVSWGGHESLMIPSLVFHDMPERPDSPIPWTIIRFYAGLESPDYLIADLKQALDQI